MVIGWAKGHPLGVHPIDNFVIESLGGNQIHKELVARFTGSCHGSGKVENK